MGGIIGVTVGTVITSGVKLVLPSAVSTLWLMVAFLSACAVGLLFEIYLVKDECSSQSPYRLMCACKDPASFQSFVMFSILNIAPRYAYLCCFLFHGVVPSAELAGVEEHTQNLHVILRGAFGNHDTYNK